MDYAGVVLLVYDAALSGGFPDELVVVIDDAFEIVGAIIEFPELLVDGGLVVQDIDDELLINILAGTGGIL
jgi:hypothetical protein